MKRGDVSGTRLIIEHGDRPNGADLAPDAMYDAIRERGIWVLD